MGECFASPFLNDKGIVNFVSRDQNTTVILGDAVDSPVERQVKVG